MLSAIWASILETLYVMGWMGIVLFLLAIVNIVGSTVYNVKQKQEGFSFKRLFGGLGRTALFYGSSIFVAVAFTIVPYINEMISSSFGVELFGSDMLQTLSSVGVLGVCVATIIKMGQKALEGIRRLSSVTAEEKITWEVEEEEESENEEQR